MDLATQVQKLSRARLPASVPTRLLIAAQGLSGDNLTDAIAQLSSIHKAEHGSEADSNDVQITAVLDSPHKSVFRLGNHLRCTFDPYDNRLAFQNVSAALLIMTPWHDGEPRNEHHLKYRDEYAIDDHCVWTVECHESKESFSVRVLPRQTLQIVVNNTALGSRKRALSDLSETADDSRKKRKTDLGEDAASELPVVLTATHLRAQGHDRAIADFSKLPMLLTVTTPPPDSTKVTLTHGIIPFGSSRNYPVYAAKHGRSDNKVVYKFMSKPTATAGQLLHSARAWLSEVEAMKLLDHENVINTVGADARFHAIITPYYAQGDLTSLMNQSNGYFSSSLAIARTVAHTAARGLDYLHSQSRVHNDIKPGNILLTSTNHAVICDFGHATVWPQQQTSGTHAYLPPESFTTVPRGFPSDVYAYGLVLFWLASIVNLPEKAMPWFDIGKVMAQDRIQGAKREACLAKVAALRTEAQDLLQAGGQAGTRRLLLTLGFHCTTAVPDDRPTMSHVLNVFEAVDKVLEKDPADDLTGVNFDELLKETFTRVTSLEDAENGDDSQSAAAGATYAADYKRSTTQELESGLLLPDLVGGEESSRRDMRTKDDL